MLSLAGWLTTLLAAGLTIAANILLRTGVGRAGGFGAGDRGFFIDALHLAMEPAFIIGMTLYGSAALVWFYVVSTQPLSIAYIVMVSVTFVGVTLLDSILFGASLHATKLVGMGVILAGIALVSWPK